MGTHKNESYESAFACIYYYYVAILYRIILYARRNIGAGVVIYSELSTGPLAATAHPSDASLEGGPWYNIYALCGTLGSITLITSQIRLAERRLSNAFCCGVIYILQHDRRRRRGARRVRCRRRSEGCTGVVDNVRSSHKTPRCRAGGEGEEGWLDAVESSGPDIKYVRLTANNVDRLPSPPPRRLP